MSMRSVMQRKSGLVLAVAAVLTTLLLLCSSGAHAFSFKLQANTERCFAQEIPSNTDLKITYGSDEVYGGFLDAIFVNAEATTVFQEKGKDNGVFNQYISIGGEYTFCLISRQPTGSAKSREVLLLIQIGADTKDYGKLATKNKLRPMEVQMRVMEDTVTEVHNEFIYLKDREMEMRNTNEHMTAMVMWMSIGLILLFAAFSYLQMRHLKRYFKKKRMID